MAKINRHNYESFFIDYIEGNLSVSKRNEFLAFLESNPDIKEELQAWEEVKINPDTNVFFPEKHALKKSKSILSEESPFEELCIAKMEGDLTDNESSLFDQYIREEPEKAKIYNLYSKTKLAPDKSIIFPEKEKLKASNNKLIKTDNINYQHILGFAASITLIIGLFFNTSTNDSIEYHKYSNLSKFKNNTSIIAHTNIPKNNSNFTNKDGKQTKNLISINNNILPIAKIENLNNNTSSNNSISKLNPTYFSELKPADDKIYTTETHEIMEQGMLFADQVTKSSEATTKQKRESKNSGNYSIGTEQPNRFLLDLADLGFKSISKLTGKEIELERSYSKKGKLKRLAFKTESFSVSTKINE